MRLASLAGHGRDGRLVVVSADAKQFGHADHIAATLQDAIERWAEVEASLRGLSDQLNGSALGTASPITENLFAAPLPRAWQWLDGSAYPSHGELMDKVLGVSAVKSGKPLMYQGMSHQFIAPTADVKLPRESDGIDFEGEFGVIVDETPMGVSAADAFRHIKLLVQINDWSLRALAGPEMKTGFGWVQAKPACSMAPFAITPDELGGAWRDGRIHMNLLVDWNGKRFGAAHGGAMEFGFHQLVAHAAATRTLCAGTVIGSGTVSNANFREIGSSCVAERRGIEVVDTGAPKTEFMKFGDSVRMEARTTEGASPFGVIEQHVVAA